MTSPYRSLPEEVPTPTDPRVAELRREVERLTTELSDERAAHRRLAASVTGEGYRAAEREQALRQKLYAYESKYGGINYVESALVELQQLKRAYQAALERIAELEKKK